MSNVKQQKANRSAIDCQSLKMRMRQVGLSYRRVAPLVGCNFSYLSDILNGKRLHPGYAVRQRLADLITSKQHHDLNRKLET